MTTAGPCLSGDAVPTGPGWLCPAPWCKAIKASHRRWLLGLPASWLCCLLGRLQHPLPRAPSFGPPRARGSCLVVGECRRPQGSLHLAPGRAAGAPGPWRRTGNRKEPRWRGRVAAPAAAETHAGLRPRRGWKGAGAPPPVLAEGEEQGVGAAGTSLRAGRREKASFDPGHGAAQADRALPQAPVGGEEEAVSQGAGTWGGRPKQARAQPARCRVGSSRTEQGRGGMGWRGHREVTCRLRWARACG